MLEVLIRADVAVGRGYADDVELLWGVYLLEACVVAIFAHEVYDLTEVFTISHVSDILIQTLDLKMDKFPYYIDFLLEEFSVVCFMWTIVKDQFRLELNE